VIILGASGGAFIVVLEPNDIKIMKSGTNLPTPLGIGVGYTPDGQFVVEQLKIFMDQNGGAVSGEKIDEIIKESQGREEVIRENVSPSSNFRNNLKAMLGGEPSEG